MTQEDKELLLKDLSARLPYGVICTDSRHGDSRITDIDTVDETVYCDDFDEYVELSKIKPYLRSMSSMTEGEVTELAYKVFQQPDIDIVRRWVLENKLYPSIEGNPAMVIDWLSARHFDYRGLIEKNLAIEVTKENNPYEA